MKKRVKQTPKVELVMFFVGLCIAIVVTMLALSQSTELRKKAAEPDPISGGRKIVLSIGTFTDQNGIAGSQPTIYGSSEPGANITVSIFPDGLGGEVIADNVGNWVWKPAKALTSGAKTVAVVAKKDTGQGQMKQSFTVPASKGGNPFGLILILMILVALGFGGYVYLKK